MSVNKMNSKKIKSFSSHIQLYGLLDSKPKGVARLKCWFGNIEKIDFADNVIISGPRQTGKTLFLINYALHVMRNQSDKCIVIYSNNLNQQRNLKKRLDVVLGNCSPNENGEINTGDKIKSTKTNSEILFANDLIYAHPTHLLIDDVDFIKKNRRENYFSITSDGVKIKETPEMQKIFTCLTGFQTWVNMGDNDVSVPFWNYNNMNYDDFEYLDKINHIESISLRLKEDLLDKAKSIAKNSNISLSEYLRSVLEKDIETKELLNNKHSKDGKPEVDAEKFF